jgi:hypothetical protein
VTVVVVALLAMVLRDSELVALVEVQADNGVLVVVVATLVATLELQVVTQIQKVAAAVHMEDQPLGIRQGTEPWSFQFRKI